MVKEKNTKSKIIFNRTKVSTKNERGSKKHVKGNYTSESLDLTIF